MNRQVQQITFAIVVIVAVILSVPFFFGQTIDVEYEWNTIHSQLANKDFWQDDYSGRCTGREELEDGAAVTSCDVESLDGQAIASPVDFGPCWVFGCDGIITHNDYQAIDGIQVSSVPELSFCETVLCEGDPIRNMS